MNSYSISELYEFAPDIESRPSNGPNVLTEKGSLNGAEFIEIRISAQRSRVGIIFDIRGLSFDGSNTAVLVLTGVGNVSWSDERSQNSWTARPGNWEPTSVLRPKPSPPSLADGTAWAQRGELRAMDVAEQLSASAIESTESKRALDGGTMATDARSTTSQPIAEGDTAAEYILCRTGLYDRLAVSAHHARIYVGHVDGMDGPCPDMRQQSNALSTAYSPQWSSVMVVHEHYSYP